MRNALHLIPGGKGLLLLVLPLLLAVGALAGTYFYRTSVAAPTDAVPPPAVAAVDVPAPPGLLVHVVGAVAHPGLYRLKRGDRVYDAISAAGGLTPAADMTRLPNLAGRLKDGEQVKVPFAKGLAGGTVTVRTSLNTATLEELEVLPGFSEAFAQEVIDYRINYGGFQSSRELVEILGMSEADFVIARRYLTL